MVTYSLNQTDKDFLYKKYMKQGLAPKEAYKNIKQLSEHLKFLAEKMKAKKRTEKEINDKLRQEYEELVMKIEFKTS